MSLTFKEITREERDREQLQRFTSSRERVVSVAVSALLPDVVGITVENGFVELIDINSGNFRLFLTYLEGEMVPLETCIRCFSLLPCLEIAVKVGIVDRIKRTRILEGTVAHPPSPAEWPSPPYQDLPVSPSGGSSSSQRGLNAFFLYSIGYSNQILIADTSSGEVTVLTECESRPSVLAADGDYVMCGEGSGKVSVWNLMSIMLRFAHSPASRQTSNEASWVRPSSSPSRGRDGGNSLERMDRGIDRRSSRVGGGHSTWLSAVLDTAVEAEVEGSIPLWSAFPSSHDALDRPSITGLARCRYQLFCLTSDCHCAVLHVDSGMVVGKLAQELAPLVSLLPFPSAEERGITCWGGGYAGEEQDAAAPLTSMIAAYEDQLIVYRERDGAYEDVAGAAGTVLECSTHSVSFPAGIVPVPPPREGLRVYGYEGRCASSAPIACLTCSEDFIAAGTKSGVVILYRCSPAFGIIEEIRRFDVWFAVVAIQLFSEAESTKTAQNGSFLAVSTPGDMRPTLPINESLDTTLLVVTATGNVWRWPLKELLLPGSTLFQQNAETASLDPESEKKGEDNTNKRGEGKGSEADAADHATSARPGERRAWKEGGESPLSSFDDVRKENERFGTSLLLQGEEKDDPTKKKEKEKRMGMEKIDSPPPSPSCHIPVATTKDGSNDGMGGTVYHSPCQSEWRVKGGRTSVPEENSTMGMQKDVSPGGASGTKGGPFHTERLVEGREEQEVQTAYTQWKQRLHRQLSSPLPYVRQCGSTSSSGDGGPSSWLPQEDDDERPGDGHGVTVCTIPGLRRGTRMDPRVVDALLSNAAARNVAEENDAPHALQEENTPMAGQLLPTTLHGSTEASIPAGTVAHTLSEPHSEKPVRLLPPLLIGQAGEWNSTAMQEERADALRMEGKALEGKSKKDAASGVCSWVMGNTSSSAVAGGTSDTGHPPPPLLVSSLAYQFPITAPHVRLQETLYQDVPQIVEVLAEDKMQQSHPRPYHHLQCRQRGNAKTSGVGDEKCDANEWEEQAEPFKREVNHHAKSEEKQPQGISGVEEKGIHPVAAGCRRESQTLDESGEGQLEDRTKHERVKVCESSRHQSRENVDDLQEVTQGLMARKKDPIYEKERRRPPPNILYHHGCDALLYSFSFSSPGQRTGYSAAFPTRSLSSTKRMAHFSDEGKGEDAFFPSLSSDLILFQEYPLYPTEPTFSSVPLPLPGTFPLF